MRIGIAFDLKQQASPKPDLPDDADEEYDSPQTVDSIARALFTRPGREVLRLGGGKEFLENILRERVDIVFNIAEGRGTYRSREAQVPSVLEMLGIPYTGSDPLTLAATLDKPTAKALVGLSGVSTPTSVVVTSTADIGHVDAIGMRYPLFAKPSFEGSSKGVRTASKIAGRKQLHGAVESLLAAYREPVLVEEYIGGDEITVGVIGNAPPKVIGVMRVVPQKPTDDFAYTIEVKRDWERLVTYECPAKLPPATLLHIEKAALTAFAALGCRDVARVDFRVDKDGQPYFLEANPLPGLNPHSGDIVIMSRLMGWDYESLIEAILEGALQRTGQGASI